MAGVGLKRSEYAIGDRLQEPARLAAGAPFGSGGTLPGTFLMVRFSTGARCLAGGTMTDSADYGEAAMRIPLLALGITTVLVLGSRADVSAQWTSSKVEVRGLFGQRVLGEPLKPGTRRMMMGLRLGPSGDFRGIDRSNGRTLFPGVEPPTAFAGSGQRPLRQFPAPWQRRPLPPPVPQLLPELPAAPPLEGAQPEMEFETAPEIWFRSQSPPAGPAATSATPTGTRPAASGASRAAPPLSTRMEIGFTGRSSADNSSPAPTLPARMAQRLRSPAGAPIAISLEGNTATVRGEVATPYDRAVIAAFLLMEPGVWQLNNELTVAPQSLFSGGPTE